MVYKFVFISDEVDNFSREILIDSEATFAELNKAVLASVGYDSSRITSFFLCSENWEKGTEITLLEMDTDSDVDNWLMDKAVLSELISDEHQKLLFVFDNLNDRAFFMELVEIQYNKTIDAPVCSTASGNPPVQEKDDEFMNSSTALSGNQFSDFSEFYGEDDFNPDELDEEGFSNLDEGSEAYL
ncbi:MAG: hypothetical protein LBD45_02535 [Bacteroidales bacterium]|jgi:hypothetical protein|nr:hypothetical protein [Bacteroidales bacterium]